MCLRGLDRRMGRGVGIRPELERPDVTIGRPAPRRPRATANQLRLILIFLVKPQVLQASASSSNSLPSRTGVTRTTANSVPHSVQDAEASGSGGNSWTAKCFPSIQLFSRMALPAGATARPAFNPRRNAGAHRRTRTDRGRASQPHIGVAVVVHDLGRVDAIEIGRASCRERV